jgi:mono/diheme cytochrome c family protein
LNRPEPPRVFAGVALTLAATWVGLRFVAPRVSLWLGLSQVPAPVPGFAMTIYMLCAAFGALVYVSADEARWQAFLAPVVRLFALAPGPGRRWRIVLLCLAPLAAGWLAWSRVAPATDPGAAIRLQHPTQPAAYADLRNPHSSPGEDEARSAAVLYQRNCRPCHGAAANGAGPLARGFRLRPVDFTDGGTIGSVVESYPLWRVLEGHAGLPDISTPWNSAMPAWEDELSRDEAWRIVGAEYRLSGTEPRRPEGRP